MFHIHIGYSIEDNDLSIESKYFAILVGRLFDLFLTLPSHNIKYEPERLQSYGKYGMIRIKKYGVECRTLSSFFTQKERLGWVWDQVMKIQDLINIATPEFLKEFIRMGQMITGEYRFNNVMRGILSSCKDIEFLKEIDEFKKYYEDAKKDNEASKLYNNTASTYKVTYSTASTVTVDSSYDTDYYTTTF